MALTTGAAFATTTVPEARPAPTTTKAPVVEPKKGWGPAAAAPTEVTETPGSRPPMPESAKPVFAEWGARLRAVQGKIALLPADQQAEIVAYAETGTSIVRPELRPLAQQLSEIQSWLETQVRGLSGADQVGLAKASAGPQWPAALADRLHQLIDDRDALRRASGGPDGEAKLKAAEGDLNKLLTALGSDRGEVEKAYQSEFKSPLSIALSTDKIADPQAQAVVDETSKALASAKTPADVDQVGRDALTKVNGLNNAKGLQPSGTVTPGMSVEERLIASIPKEPVPSKPVTEMTPAELAQYQKQMQDHSAMVQAINAILQMMYETKKAIIQNMR